MKSQRICPNGHSYIKSSTCPVCPICEAGKSMADTRIPKLAAPARRALENAGIQSLNDFASFTENEIMGWHGMGPNAFSKILMALKENKIQLKK